jgi:hypothetical protein
MLVLENIVVIVAKEVRRNRNEHGVNITPRKER